MAHAAVSMEKYLRSSFEYDCKFVDGRIVERNGGELDHSIALSLIGAQLFSQGAECGLICLISVRVQTGPKCIRAPDLAVIRAGSPRDRIITSPPLLVVEIQSEDDALSKTAEKSAEYMTFGIEHVWVVDPYARVAYRGTANGLELVRDGELAIPETPIRIVLDDLFAELDRV